MLKLSTVELGIALAGLNAADRLQLLSLLQQRAEVEAEQVEDTRPPLEQLLEHARQQSAAKSGDPEKWLEADEAYWGYHRRHYQRLVGERRSDAQDINAWMTVSLAAWNEAGQLAAAECPHPGSVRIVEPAPDAATEAVESRPALPRAVQQDVEWTRARRDEARIAELLAKVGVSE